MAKRKGFIACIDRVGLLQSPWHIAALVQAGNTMPVVQLRRARPRMVKEGSWAGRVAAHQGSSVFTDEITAISWPRNSRERQTDRTPSWSRDNAGARIR